MARYYCVQASHPVRGWVDLPSLASLKQKEAERDAEEFARRAKAVARVIRKPHGWVPFVSASLDEPISQVLAPVEIQAAGVAPGWVSGEERVAALRQAEKLRRREAGRQRRRPTRWSLILSDWLGSQDSGSEEPV